MSVKIKISYNTDEELDAVLHLLSPAVKSYKIAKKQEGAHKNAYVILHKGMQEDAHKNAHKDA